MASNDQGFKIGEAAGNAQNKAGELAEGAKDGATRAYDATKDKAAELQKSAADATKSAEAGKKSTEPNFAQKTGQQIKDTTIGAVDAVKNTFGMGGDQVKK